MKKLFYCLAALALSSLTACTSDDLDNPKANGDEATVTFTVSTEDAIQSRAWNSGENATELTWVAYKAGTKDIAAQNTATLENLKTSVDIRLLKGYEYDIVFWAQSKNATYYTFDPKTQVVSISYDGAYANDEDRDAFYAVTSLKVTKETEEQTVTLYRPFAKILLMTSETDILAARSAGPQVGTIPINTKLVVKNAYTKFNLVKEDIEEGDQPVEAVFNYNDGSDDGSINGFYIGSNAYYMIAQTFFLTKPAGQVVDADFGYAYGDKTNVESSSELVTINSIPVKKNQRTIVYGDFYTKSTTFNVEIDPNFDYYLNMPTSYQMSEFGKSLYNGETVVLKNDTTISGGFLLSEAPATIDLNGKTLTFDNTGAIGIAAGRNLTIKGGTIKYNELSSANATAFYVAGEGTLNVEDATIYSTGSVFYPEGKNATVNAKNVVISTTGYYGIATNASSSENWGVVVNLENCDFTSSAGSYLNIPGTYNLKDTKITGTTQGFLVRGGTVNISGCTFTLTADPLDTTFDGKWSQGASVPQSALTIGNDGSDAYYYKSVVSIDNTTLNAPGTDCRALYVWPNAQKNAEDEFAGVDLTIGDNVTYNGRVLVNTNNLLLTGTLPEGWEDITSKAATANE